MSILSSIRQPLATALAGVSANVFTHVPENVPVPAVILVPDSPYLEANIIGKATANFKINLTITCCVAYASNPAALDNLEQLTMSVISAIPAGYDITVIERPTVTQVGSSTMLVSDIRVSTYYTN
jgi:hypothetical protein